MKAVIFAGGIGTRMWPASRVKTPKQFNQMVGNKSTLELMYYEFLGEHIDTKDIYVATNKDYVSLVTDKVKDLSDSHVFQEPAMRDLGPAVGYAMTVMNKIDPDDPVAIVWSDDLVKKPAVFHKILSKAEDYLRDNSSQIVYIGQKPLYPDQNKGWIHRGEVIKHFNGIAMYKFKDWHYRPPLKLVHKYFESGEYAVNTGYFVSTPRFIVNLYKKFAPEMYKSLERLADSWGSEQHLNLLEELYPKLDKISFDDLIISQTKPEDAVVMIADLGWYGFGDWESIKEALQVNPNDVVTKGQVVNRLSKDSLIYNFSDKLVTTIGIEELLVVVTDDVVMVCPKNKVPEIKKTITQFKGTELEKYT